VSWEAYAWALLAAVLVGGFAWYERSRPPARTVALVAALAALAVAGRLVFTPIPNVVATTDIVLITGFAVGAAPGFAVGALAAAVSNLWLGQGPWTPWEMAGWGMVGLGGAALGALTGRRIGRYGLAIACGLAGFAYGALLDYSVMVSYGGEQSLDRYLAISARGVPFNAAHAAGNVVLALAAGPALVRMISRYRERFEFRWRAAGAAPLALLVAVAIGVATPARASAASAVGWLQGAQNPDGGFGVAPGTSSSATMTGWAVLGLEAARRSPFAVTNGGATPLDYLRREAGRLSAAGDLERTILAVEGAGVSSRRFGGRHLPSQLRRHVSSGGSVQGQVNLTAFGILALRSAGASRSSVRKPARWLRAAENGDGGWGFQASAPSDADSTGAALQGLAAAGASRHALRHGVAFLRRVQDRDGGFPLGGTTVSNAQSTAWAIQGLVAAGVSPSRVREHRHSPLDYLSKRQRGDGHYTYSASSDQTPVWVTGQALVAVRRDAFPVRPVARPVRHRSSPAKGGGASGGSTTTSGSPASDTAPAGIPPAPAGGSHPGGSRNQPSGAGGGGESAASGAAPGPGSTARRVTGQPHANGQPVSAPVDSAATAPSEGGSHTAAYAAGGLAALALVLAGGFLWYRRRLP
jgi:energy-coupling factor transport system substrate-specific component